MNPLRLFKVTPFTQWQVKTSSQREALMTWGGGLCVSGPGRAFRLLFSTLRAPGRQRLVLPNQVPHGGTHRGQACWAFPGCSVLIRGDLHVLQVEH